MRDIEITRRRLLQTGMAAGGVLLLGGRGRAASGGGALPPSPALQPFVMNLPVPPAPKQVAAFSAPDCAPFVGKKTRFFKLVAEERLVRVHPDLPPTAIWGYRDAGVKTWPFLPGPIFRVPMSHKIGEGVVVRHTNALPTAPRPFGVPELTVHLHSGHQPSASDGFPTNLPGFPPFTFGIGESRNYCYPMLDHGFSVNDVQVGERPSTMWYHDHILDFTRENVYRGLASLFIVSDELDTGKETTGLRLPSGAFDVPLALSDKVFAADGTLLYDVFNHDGFLGDTFLVNGAVQPRLAVKRRKYRFRFLDASNARFYTIFLTDAAGRTYPFDQIGNEGGLFSGPLRGRESFTFAPSNRVEIVVDFSAFPKGTELFFENRAFQVDGRGPAGLVDPGTRLLKLVVGDKVPDPSRVPDVLRPFEAASAADIAAAVRKEFVFERRDGSWVINGQVAGDLRTPLSTSPLGEPEIWRLVNKSGGWFHPIHVHLDFMRVLTRNGQTPPPDEQDGIARKDAVILGPNDVLEVFLKFQDYPGPFTFHCHNVEHEDMAMMARFDAV